MRTYNIDNFIPWFKPVVINRSQIEKIDSFVCDIVKYKKNEYKMDAASMAKRFYTGILGEVALGNYLRMDTVDWTIGESSIYNIADLKSIGLDIGVKTVEYGKWPIIHKHPVRPEIINIKWSNNLVLIAGLATIELMERYQDDSLILSDSLKTKGTKTGFYGFRSLIPFNSYSELVLRAEG